MRSRRAVLASMGALTVGTATVTGSSQRSDDDPQGTETSSSSCKTCNNVTDSKRTGYYSRQGDIYLTSKATEVSPVNSSGDTEIKSGSIDVEWSPTRGSDADRITLYIKVIADGNNAQIEDAPAKFTIDGNVARAKTSLNGSNTLSTSYNPVRAGAWYCPPDLRHEVQAVVSHDGTQDSESHSLNPCDT